METDTVVQALGALAQEHRLAAFRQLVEAGPDGLAAGLLAQRLGIAPSSLSFHLAQLSHAGLVGQVRRGRSIIYTADFAAMTGLIAYLTQNCCAGSACGVESPGACTPTQGQERNVA